MRFLEDLGAMNPCFPDWNIGAEFPFPIQKPKPLGMDGELVELLWEHGQVVLHSQTHHPKPGPPGQLPIDSRMQVNKLHDSQSISRGSTVGGSCENQVTTSLIQDTETVSWIDDSFDMEFNSHLCEFPVSNPVEQDLRPSNNGASHRTLGGEVREYSSAKTVGSSHCGSNQVVNDVDTSRVSSCGNGDHAGLSADVAQDHHVGKLNSQSDRVQTETAETAITSSSSGGSDTSFRRIRNQPTNTNSQKRKSRDAGDSDCQSKATELESVVRKKAALKSGSSRKSRAAEVHNLSERRRRDRINEKMRALQELLPNSNKTDKASTLDNAIEYMKSLQLQLQMMWMGSGMASLMFPGVQHYMSRLGMGIGPLAMPSIYNQMQLSRLPLIDQATMPNQSTVCQSTILNPINYHTQLQNSKFSEQYANYMVFHRLQRPSSYDSNTSQHNHLLSPSGNSGGPSAG